MVMMAFLNRANIRFEPQNLNAVLAHRAVWRRQFSDLFANTLGKGFQDLLVIVQIACFHELNVRISFCNAIRKPVNPVDQDAREQEIGKDNDAPVAKTCHMIKTGLDQGEGDAGITDFAPAKAHPFPQHTRDL